MCYLKRLPPPFRLKWNSGCIKTLQIVYRKAVFPHWKAAWVQCTFTSVRFVLVCFFSSAWSSWQVWQQIRAGFILAGVRGSWFPPKQTVIWVEAFHRTSSTRVHEHIWKTDDCRVENGAIHIIVFINRQQFHESLVCAAVASIALDVLRLVPLTVPTLLTLIRVTLGILITCTLHVPHHLEFTRVIRPWLKRGGRRELFPLRWDVSRSEYTSSGSELLKSFFYACVSSIRVCMCVWV